MSFSTRLAVFHTYLASLFASSKSAIHETLAMACFVNGTVAVASAVIAQKIESLSQTVSEESEKLTNNSAKEAIREYRRRQSYDDSPAPTRHPDRDRDTYRERQDPQL